jgi:hypothetical protein
MIVSFLYNTKHAKFDLCCIFCSLKNVHKQIFRSFRSSHPDSKTTRICCYSLMVHYFGIVLFNFLPTNISIALNFAVNNSLGFTKKGTIIILSNNYLLNPWYHCRQRSPVKMFHQVPVMSAQHDWHTSDSKKWVLWSYSIIVSWNQTEMSISN